MSVYPALHVYSLLIQYIVPIYFAMATPVNFFEETRAELKKVTWPARTEVTRLTLVVIGVSVIVGLYIGGLDFVFTKLLQFFLK